MRVRKVFLKIYYSYNINDKFEINSKEYTNKSIKAKSLFILKSKLDILVKKSESIKLGFVDD